jgi:hypothetical protein
MRKHLQIENIEDMRRRQGIEDVALREAIRGLRIGDQVNLTFLPGTDSSAGETLPVRITRINGSEFRGKLAGRPASPGLAELHEGADVAFTADHIHSLSMALGSKPRPSMPPHPAVIYRFNRP